MTAADGDYDAGKAALYNPRARASKLRTLPREEVLRCGKESLYENL